MKKFASLFVFVIAAIGLASCTSVWPVGGATGKVGSKVGQSKTVYTIFGYDGDAGLVAAAKNGGITVIGTIDQKIETGLFGGTVTTIVTGE